MFEAGRESGGYDCELNMRSTEKSRKAPNARILKSSRFWFQQSLRGVNKTSRATGINEMKEQIHSYANDDLTSHLKLEHMTA